MTLENDADEILAAEIARLQQELQQTLQQQQNDLTSHELTQLLVESPKLVRENSQIDFIADTDCFKYIESDDDCSGDAMLSYEEITVDTAELLLVEESIPDKQPNPRSAPLSQNSGALDNLLQGRSQHKKKNITTAPYPYNSYAMGDDSSRHVDDGEQIVENSRAVNHHDDQCSYISYDEETVATADLILELSALESDSPTNKDISTLRNILQDHLSQRDINSLSESQSSALMPKNVVDPATNVTTKYCDDSKNDAATSAQKADMNPIEITECVSDQGVAIQDELCVNVIEKVVAILEQDDIDCRDQESDVQESAKSCDGSENDSATAAQEADKKPIETTECVSDQGVAIQGEPCLNVIEKVAAILEQDDIDSRNRDCNVHESANLAQNSANFATTCPHSDEKIVDSIVTDGIVQETTGEAHVDKIEKIDGVDELGLNEPKMLSIDEEIRLMQEEMLHSSPIRQQPRPQAPLPNSVQSIAPADQFDFLSPRSISQSPLPSSSPSPSASPSKKKTPKRQAKSPKTNSMRSPKQNTAVSPPPIPQSPIPDIASSPQREKIQLAKSPEKAQSPRSSDVLHVSPKLQTSTPIDDLPSSSKTKKKKKIVKVRKVRKVTPSDSCSNLDPNYSSSPSHSKQPQVQQGPPLNRPSPMLNLLGAIEVAATKRVQRLEETGGELFMQDIVPEVEEKPTNNRQLSTSMAEMISQRASARDKRLADGGEKRMRKVVIKEKDEYKKDFSSIVGDAAAMGRLTRLNEYTVEAVAQPKKAKEEWKSNGLLAIQWKSSHMSVIHDAAAAGNATKMPELTVSNFSEVDETAQCYDASNKPLSSRMQQLLLLDAKVGEGLRKIDSLVVGRKEQQGKLNSLLVKPMQSYSNVADVKLPRQTAPKINPAKNAEKLSKMKRESLMNGRPMIDISSIAAELAWERRARLDRPGSLPKVREVCPCPYCESASPYQTFAYREIERKGKEEMVHHRPDRLDPHEQKHVLVVEDPQPVNTSSTDTDEIERKRLERQRIRDERRQLKQAVAEAEAAVAKAIADVQAAKVKKQQEHCEMQIHNPTVIVASSTIPSSGSVNVDIERPEEAPTKISSSVVKERVGAWNTTATAVPSHSASKYKNEPPPNDTAGCKCVIM